MALLSSFFREKFCASLSHTILSKQLFAYLQKGPLDKRFLQSSLLNAPKGASPELQMQALQALLRIVLMLEPKMTAVQNWVYPAAKEILWQAVSEEVTAIFLLKKLCQKLLQQEVEDTSVFGLWPAAQKEREELFFFHPYYTLQSLLFLGMLVEFNPSVYKEKAIQAFLALPSLLDHEEIPFVGLGLKEKEFSKERIYLQYYLIYLVAGRILKKNAYHERAEQLGLRLKPLLSFLPEEEIVTATLVENWILERTTLPSSFPEKLSVSSQVHFPEVGLFVSRFSNHSYLFSLSGNQTSLGALSLGAIKVVALGPQLYDLRSTDGFGIHKRASLVEKDFSWEKKNQEIQFKGLTALSEVSKWIQLEVKAREKRIDFWVTPWQQELLYFTFYVQAESVILGEQTLKPCTLQSHQEIGNTLRIQKGNDVATIRPLAELPVKVISLAGKNCFWDSDFLLALSLTPRKENHFCLEFS